jgi:hypothetical protein
MDCRPCLAAYRAAIAFAAAQIASQTSAKCQWNVDTATALSAATQLQARLELGRTILLAATARRRSLTPARAAKVCAAVMSARRQAWLAYRAIESALWPDPVVSRSNDDDENDPRRQLTRTCDAVLDATEALDVLLDRKWSWIRTHLPAALLAEWRRALRGGSHASAPPWWLDMSIAASR